MCQQLHYRVTEGEEREGDWHCIEEMMVENILNLKKETDNQVQEAQRILNKINTNRSTHIKTYHNQNGKS